MDNEFVVEDINFRSYWLILKRRWKPAIGVFSVVTLAALLLALTEESAYQAEVKLLFRSDRSTSLTGLGEALGRVESLTFEANPLDTQVEVIQSRPIIDTAIQELDLRDSEGNLAQADDITKDLSISALPGTDVLSIAYSSKEPEQAALVVNKIADIFIRDNLRENRSEAVSARDFISQQLPKTEADLNQAENNLKQFKERNQIVALSQEASSLVDISFGLQQQIDGAESQISSIDSVSASYRAQLNIDDSQYAIVLAALSQSVGVQAALEELQRVEQEIAANSALFTPDSQAISRLNRQQENLQSILGQRIDQVVNDRSFSQQANLQIGDLQAGLIGELINLDAQRQGLASQIGVLSEQERRYSDRMLLLPELEKQQGQLERDLEVAKATYQTLLTRFQELQVAESQSIGNVRLISPAVTPEYPLGSNRKLVLAAGMVAGMLLGVVVAFVLDLLDSSVKTVKEAKDIFGLTILGVIPTTSPAEESLLYAHQERWIPSVVTRDLGRSPLSEAFRMLQTNLKFLGSDRSLKSIVVSSSVPQEGKSEVAANLAVAIAQVGRRVLLVDADLRSPVQHRVWGTPNLTGLSNVLVEQIDFKDAVQVVMPNLTLLTAGVTPPNPVALLDSKRMAALLADFVDSYEIIIFDAPPLLGRADANVLGKLADGLLMVVRPGVADAAKAKSAKEFLEQSGQRVLGMVINGIDIKAEPDSYFYYNETLESANLSHPRVAIPKRKVG